ncbi:transglycosylase SLT domain-containing protein [Candidatus Nucleicultrix amoebiphila]|uniref:transglycosylase SLT domain-containing protein n=1 Tax=Candidatus Nucleicultrix amoebiphila TaxID=1509244 RepID=UPI000A269E56|nr:transglycosylase SLT domain-containing protein [Candidatus Nucleicultrix amoebiphila]
MKLKARLIILGLCNFSSAFASLSPYYIEKVAHTEQVPPNLLRTIALVESGVEGLIWPWTVNVRGKAHYFKTRLEAENFLNKCLQKGITNIDVGCMQINWHWHQDNFNHPKELLSPEVALPYAASLLRDHQERTGSWMKAALLYHSKSEEKQALYKTRLLSKLKVKAL